ncbi:TetR/AcrR family transcriptional regulator [Demequina rhizosphaerae]|uniref:TetR/AcrR family transcriptional regulator n=1 Tax=Demequina rhizosphaerae TaxID=1638985 RepID=UPI000782BBDD|nr:TetR/AcrR family transcriptional regulator [Demequina rhizosphaerae]
MATQRGAYKKSAKRREEILDAAFDVFSRQGYTAASVNEIARTVGMTQPGLLHHFGSKLALLEAVLERRDQLALDILSGRHDVEFLRGLLEIARRNKAVPGLLRLYSILAAESSAPDHPAHEYISRRFGFVVAGTARAFEEIRDRGLLRDGIDPRTAALETTAMAEGLQLLWLQDVDVDMESIVRGHFDGYLTAPLAQLDATPVAGS